MSKDWVGNKKATYVTLGASNHTQSDREENDYYATEPRAVELLCELEKFNDMIWEPACGEGHISRVLKDNGYTVWSSDIIDRGYGNSTLDFLKVDDKDKDVDIITNPPYKYALEFVKKSLDVIKEGNRVAMFLKLTFLEGKKRREFFNENPPKTIYVSSSRLECGMNGKFTGSSAATYAWFIWEKGYKGDTIIKWFN